MSISLLQTAQFFLLFLSWVEKELETFMRIQKTSIFLHFLARNFVCYNLIENSERIYVLLIFIFVLEIEVNCLNLNSYCFQFF